jgi:formate dehydrogenase major subunit
VFQILKRHFARYTPEMVERVCGTPPEQFRAVCEAWTANSNRERTTALVYSVGWTQHSVGAQYIRSGAIIQLLLGNIGRPGGGVFALRGHASIQGSTDIPTLFNLLPGYLPMPSAESSDDLDTYLDAVRSRTQKGYWAAAGTYMVSLLKEYFGEHATAENDFGFDLLPRISGDHGTYRTVMDMVDGGKVFGYFLLGQNPAVGSAHGKLQRLGMANLDWVVVRDLAMIESATFWKDSPEIETGEISPETCRTEVFFFPAASHVEKEGTFTQTQRMIQWRRRRSSRPATSARPVVLLPPGPDGQGAVVGVDGPARRARYRSSTGATRSRARGRMRSRRPKTSCGGSTATTSPPARPSTATSSSRPTAPPPAAAGSTPASTRTG